ncbi:hypothetical protein CXB51_029072 [Gossypium anomalum]|uniref:Reverse transcriptase domain-containing protein n=1 Tax=Gossypium anomalum TaxID=47600 RepID=A0A8J6CLE7_9ROSI|nr:hypothetical protein CXB51_029072 [Gossypium anomalum]
MNITVFSWNYQGCANIKFPRIFREYDMEYEPDIISLLKPRISGAKADKIIAKLGFQYSHRVEAIGFSGGIWLGWKGSVCLEVLCNHPQFILTRVWKKPSIPWMAIRDFNAVLAPSEKSRSLTKGRHCPHFGDFVDSAELHDLRFKGPPFTWHRGYLSVRLDRALGNGAWIQNFPNCRITHLLKIKSNHRPLLLVLNPIISEPWGRPFRFLAGWIEHPGFDNFFKDNWECFGNFSDSLGKFTYKLKKWNKNVYGNITTRKKDLIKRIASIQRISDYYGTHHLNQMDLSLCHELVNVLHHEKLLWRQKTGNWIYDPEPIEKEANEFFQRLYREVPDPLGILPPIRFPHLDPVDIGFLAKSVSNEEIKEQAGFITGRSINDNIILAQEVIHSMRCQKKRKWMVIKIDLEKAYDRVRWNGVHLPKFSPARGICQGCPLSPYLFVLCMEWLGHLIQAAISERNWSPIRLSRGMDKDTVDSISSLFGFQQVHNLGHYLGVPLLHQRITSGTLRFVVEKVRGKLKS